MKKTSCLVLVACTLLAGSAAAQNKCTVKTIHARYGATCLGSVATTAGGPLLPFALLGTCSGDSTGFFTCSGTQSFNGVVLPSADTGPSVVNPDCTGQITYNKGTASELDFNFFILNDGNEIRGMLQNAGSAVQCDLVRMDGAKAHEHD